MFRFFVDRLIPSCFVSLCFTRLFARFCLYLLPNACFALLFPCRFSSLFACFLCFLCFVPRAALSDFLVCLRVFVCICWFRMLALRSCLLPAFLCVSLPRAALPDSAPKRKKTTSQREKHFWEARKTPETEKYQVEAEISKRENTVSKRKKSAAPKFSHLFIFDSW